MLATLRGENPLTLTSPSVFNQTDLTQGVSRTAECMTTFRSQAAIWWLQSSNHTGRSECVLQILGGIETWVAISW